MSVHVCIHASDYECTVCCVQPRAKWTQIVPVRYRGRGRGVFGWVQSREWGGGQLLAHWRAYLWILIERPLCYSLSLSLTHRWIGGQSPNPLNSVPKGNMNKRSRDNWHSASMPYWLKTNSRDILSDDRRKVSMCLREPLLYMSLST